MLRTFVFYQCVPGMIPELNIHRLLSATLVIFFPRKTIESRYGDVYSAMNVCMVLSNDTAFLVNDFFR